MSLFNKIKSEGSFGFCNECPSNKNCCARMKTNSPIDNAIIFNEEIIMVENFLGMNQDEFLQIGRYPEKHPYQTIKHNDDSGCVFLKEGQCAIYPVRPLDCRFFPFDIIEDDNWTLRWIVYTGLCPVDFDFRPSFQKLKNFFDLPESLARAYSRGIVPSMKRQDYLVLDPLY